MKRLAHISLLTLAIALAAVVSSPCALAEQRIESVSTSGPSATGEQGHIVFTAGGSEAVFSIYSITGQIIRVVHVSSGSRATVDLPRGFYIVKCNNLWSRKVVVR